MKAMGMGVILCSQVSVRDFRSVLPTETHHFKAVDSPYLLYSLNLCQKMC